MTKRIITTERVYTDGRRPARLNKKKLTPDDLLQEALKDDPIAEMAKLITQRHAIQQSINTLLPKMTKDEVTEVYHTLYRIAQKVNERES